LEAGITTDQLREVILTGYLFDGYPAALEGFRILSELALISRKESDAHLYNPENIALWRERGVKLCKMVYGAQYESLMKRVEAFAPELRDAMIVEGYGKVLSRPQLDIRLRELCVVTILAVKSRHRQLLSHTLGSLRLGVTIQQLHIAIKEAIENQPKEKIQQVYSTIELAIDTYNKT